MYKSLHKRNRCEFLPLSKGPCQASILEVAVGRKNWTLNNYLWICTTHFVSGRNSDDPLSLEYISTPFTHKDAKLQTRERSMLNPIAVVV